MSIKYELSLWRDYPGSTGIREEKIATLAATGMDFAGRAQNIKLKREYTGKITLEFEIPVKYMDPFSGETVRNPLCTQVMEKSKLKLWRDELWYNPFGGTKTLDSKTGVTKYAGAWEQGRWYDLVVDSHKEKRSKKQLFYSYTCNSLFISELSRNGYSLQFVPDTDLMSANGMGTAHDLAERIVDGTGWEYIKTEVFPDYKEEFNAVTGETVKTPVSTDQVEFAKGLERYCYCYEVEVEGQKDENGVDLAQKAVKDSLDEQLYEIEHPESNEVVNITRPTYGFTNNKFWWKAPGDTNKKNYVLGHIKTDISINAADNIMCADSGEMKYYTDFTETAPTKLTGATDIGSIANLWAAVSGSVSYERTALNNEGKSYAYLRLTSDAEIVYEQGASKPLSQGKLYCVKIDCAKTGSKVQFSFSDGAVKTDGNNKKLYAFTKELSAYNGSVNAYGNTYWFTVPKYINKPYFYIKNLTGAQMDIRAIYIYEFKGATKEIDKLILEKRSSLDSTSGLVHDLLKNDFPAGTNYTPTMRNVRQDPDDNTFQPIWLGFGKTTAEGYKKETNTYLMDFSSGGKYYQVYLPVNNNKKAKLTKISSYETDKRRSIKGEKSNRFTLIETVSKTFNCFTRFIIEHDPQGRIKLENGRPIKRFTFVSELGRKNFNGFNYGVNLESIERTIDANNLVTKCHVESLSNQFTDSNMVTIQQSKYNKLGMTYIYNFSYYLRRGLLDKDKFLKDYQQFTDDVHRLTQANLTKIEQDGGIVTRKSNLESDISTYELMLEAYKSTAAESLATIGWDRFIEKGNGDKSKDYTKFPTIDIKYLSYYWNNTKDSQKRYYCYYLPNNTKQQVIGTEIKSDGSPDTTKLPAGENYVPSFYRNINELAQFMAYGSIYTNSSGDWKGCPYKMPQTEEEFWGRGLSKDTIYNELSKLFSTQQNYNQTQAKLNNARAELEQVKVQVDEYNTALDVNNKEIQRKVTSFERKYADYITEGQWKGSDYIDADTYYLDATRAMSVSCMPKVSYNIGAVDLSQLANPYNPEDTEWGKDFSYDVGDTTYVKDEELFGNTEQLTMIASITAHVDLNKQDEIEMRNYETRFEELFQQVAAAVTSVQFNENIWGKAAGFTADGGIDETILQNAFNNNKNLVISSANNTVTQDNKGITVKDNDTGKVLRLIGGGLFLSPDGGNTYKAGITPEGINASMITTGQLDTSKIVIRSTDTPNFELTDQGLTAYSSIVDSRITRFDQFGVYSSNKSNAFTKNWWQLQNMPEDYIIANSEFSLTRSGLNFKYSKGGLTLGTVLLELNEDGTVKNEKYGLEIKKDNEVQVGIYDTGDAVFKGRVTAKSLTVGSTTWKSVSDMKKTFKIDTSSFVVESDITVKRETDSMGNTLTTAKIGDKVISQTYDKGDYVLTNVGLGTTSGKYVKISKDGLLEGNNAIIHGTIYANQGEIAGLTSKNRRLYGIYEWPNETGTTFTSYISGMNTSYSNVLGDIHFLFCGVSRVQKSSDGAIDRQWATNYFGQANWSPKGAAKDYIENNAKFYVTHAGHLHATDATITGNITARSLNIISGGSTKSWNSAVNEIIGQKGYLTESPYTFTTGTDSRGFSYTIVKANGQEISRTFTPPGSNGDFILTNVGSGDQNHYVKIGTDGLFQANNALIHGTIYANAGQIGGWLISSNSISKRTAPNSSGATYVKALISGSGSQGMYYSYDGNTSHARQDWVLWFGNGNNIGGNDNYRRGYFGITNTGKLYASEATISGNITATSLTITQNATISGTLSASNISGGSFGKNNGITIAGWNIGDSSITHGTLGAAGSMWLHRVGSSGSASIGNSSSQSGWCISVGKDFGVNSVGRIFATGATLTSAIVQSGMSNGAMKVLSNESTIAETTVGTDVVFGSTMYVQTVKLVNTAIVARRTASSGTVSTNTGKWAAVAKAGEAYENSLSDIRTKKDITEFNSNYEIFFDNLKPKSYKYIHGESGRTHTGFIAQEVVEALNTAQLTTQDFAGACLDFGNEEDGYWYLRRDEFISLNTWQIQKLKARTTELENRVAELEAKVASLTSV